MKFAIAAGSAAIGLAFIAGAIKPARADQAQLPPAETPCWHTLDHCSYDGNDYWSGCRPDMSNGWITTSIAMSICTEYHDH